MKNFLLILFLGICSTGFATHLRSGYIDVEKVDGQARTYTITIHVYTNTSGTNVLFGGPGEYLSFGDGSRVEVPMTNGQWYPQLGAVAYASFSIVHTYSRDGFYTISYVEPNRNGGMINVPNSVFIPFYIETQIKVDGEGSFVKTPYSLTWPIFEGPVGKPYSYAAGLVSDDDASLGYQLVTPQQDVGDRIAGYTLPENISINPYTGLIRWDGMFEGWPRSGEYLFTVQVLIYKEIEGARTLVGTMLRDVQVILTDSDMGIAFTDDAPGDNFGRIVLSPQEPTLLNATFTFLPGQTAELSVYSELNDMEDAFSYQITDEDAITKSVQITIQRTEAIVRSNPYLVTVRAVIRDLPKLFFRDLTYAVYTDELPIVLSDENAPIEIEVYPNPTSDKIMIHGFEGRTVNFLLYSQQGVCIKQGEVATSNAIDISDVNPGVYILQLKSAGRVMKTIRIVKS